MTPASLPKAVHQTDTGSLPAEDQRPTTHSLRVALYDAEGSTGKGVPRVKELLGKEKDVELVVFKPEDIRAGKLGRR